MITFDDFSKLDLRVGKILAVEPHPNAEKLYLVTVDIGEKTLSLVAGIKPFYPAEDLISKYVVVLINLEPKTIRGVLSQGMILAAQSPDDLSLIVCDKKVELGSKVR
ncbi:MAG: hypothetical protein KKH93_05895 [Candidatus Omnitrophica bacterium]|nr:hypothetical protein [Candidatus Omnitrophota bacterium]MBU2044259.1 hypothetical protein [Candidatus Omnitrophota bacterium]MBU2251515.1 hypothetical protein [Candidatus Omnitrophota bacterium]MBU2266080.1 hypothetical protein [Candidatus Omnitrophota bacterium]MBU2474064.1 hypothetical protein [Candidatus Omnitrophota bacterium]